MTRHFQHRRRLLKALAAAGVIPFISSSEGFASAPDKRAAIIEGAKKEAAILVYESIPRDAGQHLVDDFQKAYPFITKAEFIQVPGSQKLSRVTQESLAGGPTADVMFNNPAAIQKYVENDFVRPIDWSELGVKMSSAMTPNQYMIAAAAVLMGVLYNTQRVPEAEAPKTWDEMIDPKWKGRFATWTRTIGLMALVSVWGEAKTRDYVKHMAALQPRLVANTYNLAQMVGAGEIDLAYTIYHTALPTIRKGAPVRWINLDPVPVQLLYAFSLKQGRNPNAAKLFLSWLGTRDGALAYEKYAERGNFLVPETKTAKMLHQHQVAFFKATEEIAKADHIVVLERQFSNILRGR
jgi:iron(III) transport system substrate-binding protein